MPIDLSIILSFFLFKLNHLFIFFIIITKTHRIDELEYEIKKTKAFLEESLIKGKIYESQISELEAESRDLRARDETLVTAVQKYE